MVAEVRPEYPNEYAAITAVAQMLGIGSPETIRTWIRRTQVDAGERPGVTTVAAEELKRLRQENAELRRRYHSGGEVAQHEPFGLKQSAGIPASCLTQTWTLT